MSLSIHDVSRMSLVYTSTMPKLWSRTVASHRRAVRDATLDTAAALVARHGLRSVTMSQIAESAGIGRATLYKYFPDVESILAAWHERQVGAHLGRLMAIQAQNGSARERLEAVLETYALIQHDLREAHATELAVHLHSGEHVIKAQRQLQDFLRQLLSEGAKAGELRDDIAADELASYCLHALAAASSAASKPALRRLVAVTMAGLLPPSR